MSSDVDMVLDVAREASRISLLVDASGLAPLANQLTSLARQVPVLRGAALRACLLRLERIDGIKDSSPSVRPIDFLNSLLKDLETHPLLLAKLKEERERRSRLSSLLQEEKEKCASAEDFIDRLGTSTQEIHEANTRLYERLEGERLRAERFERDAAAATRALAEAQREVRRLQRELEQERSKELGKEPFQPMATGRDFGPMGTPAASKEGRSTVLQGTGIGSLPASARRPGPEQSVHQCLQGYTLSARRSASPAAEGQAERISAAYCEQELKGFLGVGRTVSPSCRPELPTRSEPQSGRNSSRAALSPMEPRAVRECNGSKACIGGADKIASQSPSWEGGALRERNGCKTSVVSSADKIAPPPGEGRRRRPTGSICSVGVAERASENVVPEVD